jgi:uronate dehydrogenase
MNKESPEPRRVLVTGSAGAVGQIVCRSLRKRGHDVRGFDLRATSGLDDSVTADLRDRAKVQEAVQGREIVIHLAAHPDDGDFINELLEPNVQVLYYVCDAARQAGVARLVLASSLQVVEGHGWNAGTIRVENGPAPTNHYALTKAWAELLGQMYARCYGLSVVMARIGWLPRDIEDARRLAKHEIGPSVYVSHHDAGRFFERCVESPAPGPSESAIVFVTSRPPGRVILDTEPARRILGYEPDDTWPGGLPFDGSSTVRFCNPLGLVKL